MKRSLGTAITGSPMWCGQVPLLHISSILKSNGEDVKVVQELLRHSTARMTLDTYTQALTPQKRAGHSKVVGIIRPKERVFSVCREGKGVSDVTC